MEKLGALFNELNENRLALKQSFNENAADLFTSNMAGLRELATFTELLSELPAEFIKHRCSEYDEAEIDEVIVRFQEEINEADKLQGVVEKALNLKNLPDAELLKTYAKLSSD